MTFIHTPPDKQSILRWLLSEDPAEIAELWALADATRKKYVGDQVHLRGLVEVSNRCERNCLYCGIRADNRELQRYLMLSDEILACAHKAVEVGFGTLVLQAGEDSSIEAQWLADIIRQVKEETDLAITLSLGERSDEDYQLWHAAGADRCLLRFETGNRELFDRIHPPLAGQSSDRLAILARLREIGYEIGSGVMIGIPGQSYESLADDIDRFRSLDLDMIGVGPYIPHPDTPLAGIGNRWDLPKGEQVINSVELGYRVIALARLVCPQANIPSTTALATLDGPVGRELGLQRGANIVMPNLTPLKYRQMYEIYPAKAASTEDAEQSCAAALRQIRALGRTVGTGRGDSPNLHKSI
ncbi:[FeFe] hydrogenase H-cluster radical SAM maturase HydE [Syntrophotalea acetylenivorans]|uniref:[FeFe] hydrogenase H-cluster radical SAM maturase HydE n=1 Tax=Syntrophotalea acetylenivorans TaxID=1842532 RepID=A0A1L3GM71_9BACT|nr:[FeFe] hydrogenase H-cluster radical SAM maturase HydE [Syntrophotalea acetylenivorans]APG26778.1 [FeFe] hydrogenase H-cluster radical SAM maturase HydE [Syntrophotalea acetylenivorans]